MMAQSFVTKLKKGNQMAFRQLYDRYYAKVYHYCFRFTRNTEDAEELAQQVFIQLWEQRRSIDAGKSLDGFLFTIAHHRASNFLKQQARRRNHEQACSSMASVSTEETVQIHELYQTVEQTVKALPEKRQIIFRMHHHEYLSEEEIAHALQLSVHTIKSQLAKAAQTIRRAIHAAISVALLLFIGG
ncbi:RNA polymerase sigma-70 factor [Tunicatimonas pelagia]|uniref:RNA polymerase sigma-70 factor n=1 Tax=Tunicatimonas pelagia TaxID=931531 RepID=UPI00266568E6|nr:RNA polymerase sigma-70 factor [Tunicatimonas pelagia]WKN44974.1 RNA polymerase sigma-70 factor [Tunicatimonas pelagia]